MNRNHRLLQRAQRGAVLFIALIVLVAMTLAGLGLMRSVDTGVLIAANLAFKQAATQAGDSGIEQARSWLSTNGGPTLYNSQPAVTDGQGYFANWQTNIDFTGTNPSLTPLDWSTQAVNVTGSPAGYQVRYVINRMCDLDGDPAGVHCITSTAAATASGSTKGAVSAGSGALTATVSAVFRITVRVDAPRNTKSFVQSTVY